MLYINSTNNGTNKKIFTTTNYDQTFPGKLLLRLIVFPITHTTKILHRERVENFYGSLHQKSF